jgi:hypothetical protein
LNPITIYLATRFVNFDQFAKLITGPGPGFTRAFLTTGFGVLLAWVLHRKRIYLRI